MLAFVESLYCARFLKPSTIALRILLTNMYKLRIPTVYFSIVFSALVMFPRALVLLLADLLIPKIPDESFFNPPTIAPDVSFINFLNRLFTIRPSFLNAAFRLRTPAAAIWGPLSFKVVPNFCIRDTGARIAIFNPRNALLSMPTYCVDSRADLVISPPHSFIFWLTESNDVCTRFPMSSSFASSLSRFDISFWACSVLIPDVNAFPVSSKSFNSPFAIATVFVNSSMSYCIFLYDLLF